MSTTERSTLDHFAVILMIGICTIWGVQQVVIKVMTPFISPVAMAGLRSIGALPLVWLWARHKRVRLHRPDKSVGPGLLVGLLFTADAALLYVAMLYTSASRGTIFLYTAPFMVSLVLAFRLPSERMRATQWVGMILAFAGVLLLLGEGLLDGREDAWIGDLLMLGAAASWAATTVAIKLTRLRTIAPERTLLYQLVVSALLLPPLSLLLGEPGFVTIDACVIAGIGFQILVIATFSYLCWFWLVRYYPATRLSAFSFLTPIMGVLAGVVFLDEPLTAGIIVATFVVGVGTWMSNPSPAYGMRNSLPETHE